MTKLLLLVPGSYDAYQRKGVAGAIAERDEGFFSHVYTIHFPAMRTQTLPLNAQHTVIDYAPGLWYAGLHRVGLGLLAKASYTTVVAWRASRLVRREHLSLVRGMNSQEQGFCAYLVHQWTRIPWCVSIHADYDKRYALSKGRQGWKRRLYQRLERFVLVRAPLVLVVRESLIPYAVQHGAKRKNLRVIPHGVDFRLFVGPKRKSILKPFPLAGKKLIVFAGRLSKENYVDDLVRIAKKIIPQVPDVLFVVLGEGPERMRVETTVRNAALQNSFLFLGFQSRNVVAEFRKAAAVNLCLMGGYSLIEAAASARPVIAYDVEWHHELIHDRRTGYLIPEHHIQHVAQAILTLLRNSRKGDIMGRRAQALALKNHDLQTTSALKVSSYQELL